MSTPTPTPTRTPIPEPTWDAVAKGHTCAAIAALESAGTEATALRADADANRWTKVLGHADTIIWAAERAEAEIAAFDRRALPSSDAIETLSQAAQDYADLTQSIKNDIQFGETDTVLLTAMLLDSGSMTYPSLDSQIKRLEAVFGTC